MREVKPTRYFNPNDELIDLIDVKSKKLYELLFEIMKNDQSLSEKAYKPIDSLNELKKQIAKMDIDKVEWIVQEIKKKL